MMRCTTLYVFGYYPGKQLFYIYPGCEKFQKIIVGKTLNGTCYS